MMTYSDPSRATDPYALPDVEVFYVRDSAERKSFNASSYTWTDSFGADDDGESMLPGWYWWTCLPGCLPDSEPFGPFDSPEEAEADAQESAAY